MTWPFENDTGAIVKKLAKRSLASEKRRNLMVVIAVALAAFTGVEASDVAALKNLPEFARVGEYYMLGQEHSEQGYNASSVYRDSDMIYIAHNQMKLVKGELPERENEVAVSEYFLSSYGSNAGEKEGDACAIAVSKAALTQ